MSSAAAVWVLGSSSAGSQPKPTRDQLLKAQLHFGGQSVTLPGLGTIPWFDAALQTLDANSRQVVYAMKRAAGDQFVMLTLWWAYQGSYTYPVNSGQGIDYSNYWDGYRMLIREAIKEGFYVELKLACEGQTRVNGQLGYYWGMDYVPDLMKFLRAELPWCVVSLGFELFGDGGDWSDQQVTDAHLMLRRAVGDNVIALEFGQGYNKWDAGQPDPEDGAGCWCSEAGQAVDIFQQQMKQPIHEGESTYGPDDHWFGCQILSARNLGPAYKGPTEHDPHAPFYFTCGTPRGPHQVWCYEYGLYDWVRGRISQQKYEADRVTFESWGYEVVG